MGRGIGAVADRTILARQRSAFGPANSGRLVFGGLARAGNSRGGSFAAGIAGRRPGPQRTPRMGRDLGHRDVVVGLRRAGASRSGPLADRTVCRALWRQHVGPVLSRRARVRPDNAPQTGLGAMERVRRSGIAGADLYCARPRAIDRASDFRARVVSMPDAKLRARRYE